MKVREVTVTPEVAKEFLKRNVRNRPLNVRHVRSLAREMREGRWQLNGDTIGFSGDRLIDGQHRLSAVIDSGVPVRMLVIEGLPDASFTTKDCGKKRGTGDVLAIAGEKNGRLVAAALVVVDAIEKGVYVTRAHRVSNAEITTLLAIHPGVRVSADYVKAFGVRVALRDSISSALHYLCGRKDPELSDWFWGRMGDGEGLTKAQPVYRLRERMLADRTSKARLHAVEATALAIKAWNHQRSGYPLKQLMWRTDGPKPEAFPVIQ